MSLTDYASYGLGKAAICTSMYILRRLCLWYYHYQIYTLTRQRLVPLVFAGEWSWNLMQSLNKDPEEVERKRTGTLFGDDRVRVQS